MGETGGITGVNHNGNILKSYNEGNVVGKSTCIGGIVGDNKGIVHLCINKAKVSSNREAIGGILGIQSQNNEAKTVNCYNIGEITGQTKTGGVIGAFESGQILNCYSIGKVIGTNNVKSVIGYKADYSTIVRNNFFLETLPTTDENATSKTMEEMKSQAIVDLLNQGQPDQPWSMDTKGINDGYPVLKWQLEELK